MPLGISKKTVCKNYILNATHSSNVYSFRGILVENNKLKNNRSAGGALQSRKIGSRTPCVGKGASYNNDCSLYLAYYAAISVHSIIMPAY